jgi:hypothetical protein
MQLELTDEIIDLLIDRRYLVGVPKGERDLRLLYPEMFEHKEFQRTSIRNADDVLFIWWYACSSSPIIDMTPEKRLEAAIRRAYRSDAKREMKIEEYAGGKFPDTIKAAITRMEAINVSARVENLLYTLQVRKNCKHLLGQDVSLMNTEEKDAWFKQAKTAWAMMDETKKILERGAYGVSEVEEGDMNEDDGSLRDFRNNV